MLKLACVAVAGTLAAGVAGAQGALVIYDDAGRNQFQPYNDQQNPGFGIESSDAARTGTKSVKSVLDGPNFQQLLFRNVDGNGAESSTPLAGNTILTAYVNFTADSTFRGFHRFVATLNGTNVDYYASEGGVRIDGVTASSFAFDNNFSTWQKLEIDLTKGGTLAASTLGRIDFKINPDAGQSMTLYIDDVSVQAVPEPASLALLGLGGLLVARRRRA